MTPTAKSMNDVSPYEGHISIMIENGKILNVTHAGNISLKLPNDWIHELKNVLCVPELRKNLISIRRLTNYFPHEFSLRSNVFLVMNFQTKEVIQTGNSVGCLCHINIINQGHGCKSLERVKSIAPMLTVNHVCWVKVENFHSNVGLTLLVNH